MNVFLADDNPRVCSALRILLEMETGIHIVGQAEDVETLLITLHNTRVDLLVLDWDLTRLYQTGKLIAALQTINPHLKILALGGQWQTRKTVLSNGADLFVSKSDPPDRLQSAIRQVLASLDAEI